MKLTKQISNICDVTPANSDHDRIHELAVTQIRREEAANQGLVYSKPLRWQFAGMFAAAAVFAVGTLAMFSFLAPENSDNILTPLNSSAEASSNAVTKAEEPVPTDNLSPGSNVGEILNERERLNDVWKLVRHGDTGKMSIIDDHGNTFGNLIFDTFTCYKNFIKSDGRVLSAHCEDTNRYYWLKVDDATDLLYLTSVAVVTEIPGKGAELVHIEVLDVAVARDLSIVEEYIPLAAKAVDFFSELVEDFDSAVSQINNSRIEYEDSYIRDLFMNSPPFESISSVKITEWHGHTPPTTDGGARGTVYTPVVRISASFRCPDTHELAVDDPFLDDLDVVIEFGKDSSGEYRVTAIYLDLWGT
jgi:hypothetical protein